MSENSDLRKARRAARVEENAARITPEMAGATPPTMEDFLVIKQKAENNSLEINCDNEEVENTLIEKRIKEIVLETNNPNLRNATIFTLEDNNGYLHVSFLYNKHNHSIIYKFYHTHITRQRTK